MKNRHLFLFGGGPPFGNDLGKKFAELALKENGKAAILFIERDGWKEYMPVYTNVLQQNGISGFVYLPLCAAPSLSLLEQLESCSGIIIGGGDTERYREYIVETTLGQSIIKMYHEGIPVAGFSAGALISPGNCIIPPIDNACNEHLFLKGLGLIQNCMISVHYSKWNEEENLKAALKRTNIPLGFGIDDGAGLYFNNETLTLTEGQIYTFINKPERGNANANE